MKISELGEFAFIDHFSPAFTRNLENGVLGIGDDCAVLPLDDRRVMLITTDMLIEDSHFLRHAIPPIDLGYKSLAVNLSDIAAMGGIPTYAFLSLGIPKDVEVEWMDLFFAGMNDLCNEANVQLLGGDTTRSGKHLIINIGVVGEAMIERVKYRSAALPGDIICVTGELGDSGGGLRLILENIALGKVEDILVKRHHRPRAHLAEGQWLGAQKGVHAMMDVSDGIDSDLHRIMERSLCGAHVDLNRLPCSRELQQVCVKYKWDMYELAATGGEDYCLLCTIDPQAGENIMRGFKEKFERDLFPVGKIISENTLNYYNKDILVRFTRHGFDHFA